jgi:invasion protein IalB
MGFDTTKNPLKLSRPCLNNQSLPTVTRLLSLLLLSLCLSTPAQAQKVSPGDWVSDCEEDYCVFRKTLQFVGEDSAFALFEILIDVTDGEASLVLTAPLGVALQPGVRVSVEGREWFAPLKVCYQDGCRATVEMNNDDLALLLQKQSMDIRYVPFGGDSPVAAVLPLSGLVAAISRTR